MFSEVRYRLGFFSDHVCDLCRMTPLILVAGAADGDHYFCEDHAEEAIRLREYLQRPPWDSVEAKES